MSTTVWSLLAVCLVAFVSLTTSATSTPCMSGHCHILDNQLSQLKAQFQEQQKQLAKHEDVIRQMKNAFESATSAADCADVLKRGQSNSGVYNIVVLSNIRLVFCDQLSDNGGWLVIQRYVDKTDDFNRDWKSYKEGFGDPTRNFWLGNVYLHALTAQKKYSLRIDFTTLKGETKYALYKDFAVANEGNKYKLTLGTYSGTAGDLLRDHNGMEFSTRERDNDLWIKGNCAHHQEAGWWYNNCGRALLNEGLSYYGSTQGHNVLKTVAMKIRPQENIHPQLP